MKLKKCSSTKISVNLRITTLVVMVIIIRVLTTKKNGNSSTVKVTTMIIITVIIWTYRRNNIAKTLLEHKTGQVNAHGNIQGQKHYTKKVTSNNGQGKKQRDIYHLPWTTIPGIDRWDILIQAKICHVSQSNEYYYIIQIQG